MIDNACRYVEDWGWDVASTREPHEDAADHPKSKTGLGYYGACLVESPALQDLSVPSFVLGTIMEEDGDDSEIVSGAPNPASVGQPDATTLATTDTSPVDEVAGENDWETAHNCHGSFLSALSTPPPSRRIDAEDDHQVLR